MEVTIIVTAISCIITTLVTGVLTLFIARVKNIFKHEKALGDGVQVLLRNQLIEYHEKYTERGYCPIYAKENAKKSYDAYHDLGGNGVITKLFNDIMSLPETPHKKVVKKKTNQGGIKK